MINTNCDECTIDNRDLEGLKAYNILKSDNSVGYVIQHFVPTKVNNLWAFMSEFKEESATVVIEQILDVPQEVLEGKFLRVF